MRPLDVSEDIAAPQKQITHVNIMEIMKLSATTGGCDVLSASC